MTQRDHASLAWSLAYATRRLEGALGRAAPCGVFGSHILRGVWRAACRELHYLELFVRRLLVCMAGEMVVASRAQTPRRAADTCKSRYPGVGVTAGSTPCQSGPWVPACAGTGGEIEAGQDQTKNPDKPPLFPVSERRHSETAVQARLAAMAHWDGTLPQIDVRFMAGNTGETPAPVMPAARLAARFAALADVLENPARHARRIALWRARRATAILRLGAVPGLARGGTMDLATSSFFEAERLARAVLNRGWQDPPADPDPPPGAEIWSIRTRRRS